MIAMLSLCTLQIFFRSLSRLLSLPVYCRMAFDRRLSRTAPHKITWINHNHEGDNKERKGNGKDGNVTKQLHGERATKNIEDTV